jgi:hypothetical protein
VFDIVYKLFLKNIFILKYFKIFFYFLYQLIKIIKKLKKINFIFFQNKYTYEKYTKIETIVLLNRYILVYK